MKLLLYGASILRYGQPVMWQLASTHEGLQLGVRALLSSHNTGLAVSAALSYAQKAVRGCYWAQVSFPAMTTQARSN